jgi:murein DD-endopeptidase MepM/ murein hydrolase activator NlpD
MAGYVVVGAGLAGASWGLRRTAEKDWVAQVRANDAVVAANAAIPPDTHLESIISSGANWSEVLQDMGFENQTVYQITQAAQKVFNLRRVRAGNKILAVRAPNGEPRLVNYRIDPEHELWVTKEKEEFHAEVRETPGTVRVVTVVGDVEGSLFDSVIAAGERPDLALRLAEIFAWDMDFNTDTQPGDKFRLVLEKKEFQNGADPAYGKIMAAEYDNRGHVYQAVLFHDRQGNPAYYSADGKSLQKAFLRSPLRFAARVSSHFSLHRMHPILKIARPHLGTDYAAPVGTPVQSIANGRVTFSGRKGGGGITVQISHDRGYESFYLHLSRALVRSGQRVEQGQRIGLVGATGLATGPHLDFRLRQHGKFVDFERLKLPPAYPVDKSDWAEFAAARDHWVAQLTTGPDHNASAPKAVNEPGGSI